ncbi:MAG: copper resistance protein CopC [Candidatus Nitrosocosmicus sp.]|nr:copper resistance protein CopC [Candidatus Nitrosocosmicus sp.]MDN5866262.1 copper resistance protein CopC [Candidatus Nitrosocosmicus sp.]
MNFSVILFVTVVSIVGIGIPILTSVSLLPVFGHASPVTYLPAPNEIIDSLTSLPDQVTIAFTENPEPRASNIKIMNSMNERIDNNDLRASDSAKSLSVTLDPSKVIPGVYTVNWIVLSKDDGHITKGSYVFSVKDNSSKTQQPSEQNMSNISPGYSTNITTADNVVLNFDITPFKVGLNVFDLRVYHVNGTAIENIKNVFLEFNNHDKNLGPLVDTMKKVGAGNYSSTGNYLSQEGKWEIKLTVQRIGEYDINQRIDVDVK